MNEELLRYSKGYCKLHFDPKIQQTIEFLKQLFAPYTNRVYIVGGFVRDQYMQLNRSNDIDIEVYDIDQSTFEMLMNSIKALGVGHCFFVYKYNNIDISLPRIESKIGYGHKGFEVELAKDERTAAKRRDFTMNALMVNIYTNELYDFFEGIEHIKSKKITIIDEKSFQEDSLRVLRAIRFASTFGFKIEALSCRVMQGMKINDLSNERIVNEFMKMFETDHLHLGLYYIKCLNIDIQFFNAVIDKKNLIALYKFLKRKKRFFNVNLYSYYFLYILNSFIKIDIQNLGFPKKFIKHITSQKPYVQNITLEELLIISLQMPIKNWLGALNEEIIQNAQLYNVYEKPLQTDVKVEDIINEGFEKEAIKKELYRRKVKFINDKIINHCK